MSTPAPTGVGARKSRRVNFRLLGFAATIVGVAVVLALGTSWLLSRPVAPDNPFVALRHHEPEIADDAIRRIDESWCPESAAMVLEIAPRCTLHMGHRERLFDLLRA